MAKTGGWPKSYYGLSMSSITFPVVVKEIQEHFQNLQEFLRGFFSFSKFLEAFLEVPENVQSFSKRFQEFLNSFRKISKNFSENSSRFQNLT